MKYILGLDISTSIVGIAIVEVGGQLVESIAVDLRKVKSTFEKGEHVGSELHQLRQKYYINNVFIESPLKRFMPGKSSASVITLLSQFNGIVSWLSFDIFGLEPQYLNVNAARSTYGLSFPKGTKGKQKKMMVVDQVKDREKAKFKIELTRYGNHIAGTDDRADAVVIARAGEYIERNKNNKGFKWGKLIDL